MGWMSEHLNPRSRVSGLIAQKLPLKEYLIVKPLMPVVVRNGVELRSEKVTLIQPVEDDEMLERLVISEWSFTDEPRAR